MLKKLMSKWVLALLVMSVGGLVMARVDSDAVSGSAAKGAVITFPLKLSTTQGVGGINGELTYDPTLFTAPSITEGPGASGFIALGNLVSPGHFKFVLYSDPVKAINVNLAAAYFQVQVQPTVAAQKVGTLSYTSTGASDTNANALGTLFKSVNINLQANAVHDWVLYE